MSSKLSLGVNSDEARRRILSPKWLSHCWIPALWVWSSYAFSPWAIECSCKYVTLESTWWYCVPSKCARGFCNCFGSCESNVTHMGGGGCEQWAQYCKCLTGCNHSVYYFVYRNCGRLMFLIQLWPRYAVLCWTVILFGCNSTTFEGSSPTTTT